MNRLFELEKSLSAQKQKLKLQRVGAARPTSPRFSAATAQRPPARLLSRPFYATGEHVLAGEDLPELAGHEKAIQNLMIDLVLEVGKADARGTRVGFSYGELVAMGDLFDTFDDMDGASAGELLRLRELIRRSRDHYRKKIFRTGSGAVDPGDPDWQKATNDRYIKLALDNFAHFAPSDSALTGSVSGGDRRDHRSMWEWYHRQAVEISLANRTDQGLERALAVNAFGDHFLTDAFAAGHLFNKSDVSQKFKSQLLDAQGKLTAKGNTFFREVAKKAFTGALKSAFSKHETTDIYGPSIAGWRIGFHPNIDSASRFEGFLKAVQESEPKLIGESIVAKIIHDKLNNYGGLPVTNRDGDSWPLTGDGTLNEKNLRIMQKAVARSVYDVAVEVFKVSDLNALMEYAWYYTPIPTNSSKAVIKQLIDKYTTPDDSDLIDGAAKLLQENHQMLLDMAVARGALRKA
jgi:hypothetical protein